MKKAILMMTFGSPEEISFEGVAEFFTNIRRGVRPQDHEIQTLYDNLSVYYFALLLHDLF